MFLLPRALNLCVSVHVSPHSHRFSITPWSGTRLTSGGGWRDCPPACAWCALLSLDTGAGRFVGGGGGSADGFNSGGGGREGGASPSTSIADGSTALGVATFGFDHDGPVAALGPVGTNPPVCDRCPDPAWFACCCCAESRLVSVQRLPCWPDSWNRHLQVVWAPASGHLRLPVPASSTPQSEGACCPEVPSSLRLAR